MSEDRLQTLLDEYAQLEARLADPAIHADQNQARKVGRRFAELRPMQKWVALSFSLRRRVSHPLIVRKPITYHGRQWHTANVRTPDDVDDDIRAWLTEAYLDAAD